MFEVIVINDNEIYIHEQFIKAPSSGRRTPSPWLHRPIPKTVWSGRSNSLSVSVGVGDLQSRTEPGQPFIVLTMLSFSGLNFVVVKPLLQKLPKGSELAKTLKMDVQAGKFIFDRQYPC